VVKVGNVGCGQVVCGVWAAVVASVCVRVARAGGANPCVVNQNRPVVGVGCVRAATGQVGSVCVWWGR